MTVEKNELLELSGYVQREVKKIQSSENPDNAKLFDFQTLDSNISLVLSCADFEKVENIELGTKDKQIKDALKDYRRNVSKKDAPDLFLANLSFYSEEAVKDIMQVQNILTECQNQQLIKNIIFKLNSSMKLLKEVSSLKDNPRTLKKWETSPVDPEAKVSARTASAAVKTAPVKKVSEQKTEVKPAAKRGRPRKTD